jgi:hypothetical protein
MRKNRVTHTITEYVGEDTVFLVVDEIVDSEGDFVAFEDLFIEINKKHELLDPSEDEATELVHTLGFDNLFNLCEHVADNGNVEYDYGTEYED